MPERGSKRRRFDDDRWEPTDHDQRTMRITPDHDEPPQPAWSTYRDATRGPDPVPDWVVTDPRAVDDDRGVLKTGKEAEVSLVERRVAEPDGSACLLAAKRYRAAEHRMFHRDAGYLEGRRVKESREMRAMETRTAYGRQLIASQWAVAEFSVLARLWSVGAAVPYPVQLLGTELMMEFVGSAAGVAAPRLAELRPSGDEAHDLLHQLVEVLALLAEQGYAHGDLSPYNVLVDDGRLVVIDLPQAVDLVGNPQGFEYLRRDCHTVCAWFAAHGLPDLDEHAVFDEIARAAPGGG